MADLWQDRLLVWSVVLIVGFPLLVVLLTEAVERLNRRQHPLASSLRQVRNIVLPILAVLLIVRFILDYPEPALITRLLATAFWGAVLIVSFRLFKHALASPEERQPGWRDSIPSLFLQLPRALLALFIVYYILAGVWNVDVGGLITALGIGSLVIALALQDTLSNLFSGLLLLINRPFEVGDWIETGNVEGQVTEVNWRTSLLRTRDGDLVAFPNGSIARNSLTNYSQPTTLHRVRVDFDLHISNAPNKAQRVFKEAALATPGVLAEPAPKVRTMAYEGFSIHYQVLFWIADYGPVADIRSDFATRAYYRAKRYGLKWPTPERALYYYDGPAAETARATSTEQIAALLKELPSFAVLANEAVEALARSTRMLDYGEGEQIVCAGEKERGIYVLTGGRVAISITNSDGEEREITQLRAGEFFGETGLFSRAISAVNVTALTDVELLLIDHGAMTDVINKHPDFAAELSLLIEERKRLIRRVQPTEESLSPVRSVNGETVRQK